MLNDGYGDEISHYEKWAHKVANGMLGDINHSDHDDLVQEARIGMWKALQKFDSAQGALPSYITQGARFQMQDSLRRQKWTGQDTTRGVKRADRYQPTESLDTLPDTAVGAADALDRVALAYHYGEIHSAIANLPDHMRRYVVLRFWGGMTDAEIQATTGDHRNLGSLFRTWAKPVLLQRLQHLQDSK